MVLGINMLSNVFKPLSRRKGFDFLCLCAAGWATSTTTSRGSSLSWKKENTPNGMPTVVIWATMWRGWCPCAPSAALWVCEHMLNTYSQRSHTPPMQWMNLTEIENRNRVKSRKQNMIDNFGLASSLQQAIIKKRNKATAY